MQTTVQLCEQTSDDFTVVYGVKPDCVLDSAMTSCAFNACDNGVRLEHCSTRGLLNLHRSEARTLVRETTIRMLFADDCALFVHNKEELRRITTVLALTAANFELNLNTNKSVCLSQPSLGMESMGLSQIQIGDDVSENAPRLC
ncbi:unnamed protein product [Dicrocoelium dendriticum]|nr:unnamed protein product [Dicrocoelium dendriticum]